MTFPQTATASKPLLMLISGWICSSAVWSRLAEELRDDAEIVRWEMPGFGSRRHEAHDWTFRGAVDDLERAVSDLPRPAVLLGSSAGGSLALAVAARRPSNVSAVVTVGANARWTQTEGWPFGASQEMTTTLLEQGRARFAPFLREICPSIFFSDDDRVAAGEAQDCIMNMALEHDDGDDAVTILERIYAEGDIRNELSAINVPVLLVHGDRDALTPPTVGEAVRAMVPDAQVSSIAGAAHFPILTAPRKVAEAVREFMGGRRA